MTRLPAMIIACAAVLVTQAEIANAADVPTLNFQASCRDAAKAGPGLTQTAQSCRQTELAARDQIRKEWNSFSAADRASCYQLTTIGSPGTYTEFLTCLEMKRDARNLPQQGSSTVGRGNPR